MRLLNRILERKERREENVDWAKDQIDKLTDESDDVKIHRIDSKEKIALELLNRNSTICPYIDGHQSDNIIELIRDPNEEPNEPFGWKRGTIRGMLTIWVTIGFLLITMMMIFLLPLTLLMIMDMWKILAFVFTMIVGSYFYTRIKMSGNLFK